MSETVKARGYADRAYLEKVTEAMTAFRQDDRLAGLYDVGDLNWWWRDGDYRKPDKQMFWEDEHGSVLAFGLLSHDYRAFDYEFLPSLGESHEAVQAMFRWGLDGLRKMAESQVGTHQLMVRDSHSTLRGLAEQAGLEPSGHAHVLTVLELPASIRVPDIAGYRVRSLCDSDLVDGGTPVLHQKADALKRVQETPLYDRDLHLVVETPDGRLAAECIVWLDGVNHIGIFEPVRTHPDFYRRGLGKLMLSEGLRRMSERGVTLAKVAHNRDNPAAKRLYESLGFRKIFEELEYTLTRELS
ncbi:hypothetical protein BH24DEI2_BH24DEI2_08640 [soil metagenome]